MICGRVAALDLMDRIITTVLVHLNGDDDNAFAVVGATARAMQEAGIPDHIIDGYKLQATSGDYEHVLATTKRYVIVVGDTRRGDSRRKRHG